MTPKLWAVRRRHDRLSPDWEIISTHDDPQQAIQNARDHRADGYDAKLAKWCFGCAKYTANYAGGECASCQAKSGGSVIT